MRPRKVGAGFDSSAAKNGFSPWYVRIDGKKTYFKTEALRDAMVRKINKEKEVFGSLALDLTAGDRLALIEAKRQASARGLSLWRVFEAGLAALPDSPVTIQDLATEYIAKRQLDDKQKTIRHNSFIAMKHAVEKFVGVFGSRFGSEITRDALLRYLTAKKLSPVGLRSHLCTLATFLNWCASRKQLAPGITKDILPRHRPESMPSIIGHIRLKEMLALVPEHLRPVIALQWFAGVRPDTSYRIRYEDLHREGGMIEIPPGSGKAIRREFIEHIPPTVWAWIPEGRTGRIAPAVAARKVSRMKKLWGFGTKANRCPHDVARHSFASHMAAFTKSIAETSRALTHTSEATTKRYYLNRVSHEDAVAYFALTPSVVFGASGQTPKPATE